MHTSIIYSIDNKLLYLYRSPNSRRVMNFVIMTVRILVLFLIFLFYGKDILIYIRGIDRFISNENRILIINM